MSTFAGVRAATGLVRPGHNHGCKPVEVIPGVWTAHFHDTETRDTLKAISENITVVVNAATDKCATKAGSYGDGVDVVVVEGLLDDPEALKKLHAMPEGPEKEAAKAALPVFEQCECAGNARKDFERVNTAIDAAKSAGGSSMVYCYASISRSVAFLLAYMMKDQRITLENAIKQMRPKWDATWPNDSFVKQLLEYEKELGISKEAVSVPIDPAPEGAVEMKVTAKKSSNFYVRAATSFLKGMEAKPANEAKGLEALEAKAPVEALRISGLGEAVHAAVCAATEVEAQGLCTITRIQTAYITMNDSSRAVSCAQILIDVKRK